MRINILLNIGSDKELVLTKKRIAKKLLDVFLHDIYARLLR
jgi:ferredoxin-fold anticodon binding domain-containing protein